MIPILLVALDLTSVIAALALGYYSVRMIIMMRWGRFEKSWKSIAAGAFLLCVGYSFLTFEDFLIANSFDYLLSDYAGTTCATLGILCFVVGMRQTYLVWHLKDIRPRGSKAFTVSTQ